MDPAIQPAVRKKLEADHNCTPVFLTQAVRQPSVEHIACCVIHRYGDAGAYASKCPDVFFHPHHYLLLHHSTALWVSSCLAAPPAVQVEDLYYHKFTQGVLWPLFHCIPTNFNEALLENFQSQYEVRTNQRL